MSSLVKRIDLHCHSDASNTTSVAALNAIRCPESYSRPHEVYQQARRRGMDFVTLTDHDSIEGVVQIAHLPDVIVGEELTCWFPEDGCKMHVLVFGIRPEDHQALQARAQNIYDVAEYIESRNIAHAVAHPIYRQNDKLERWHLERLLLLFKGFECLNGAHSGLHREAFEPLLDRLTPQQIDHLSKTHGLSPRWPQPWIKARTGGSDDHGLLNVGKTWTEFPPEAATTQDILNCLRSGQCRPGGQAGSGAKLAHTFYSVAVRYYTRHILSPLAKPNLATTMLEALAGQRPLPSKTRLILMGIKQRAKKLFRRLRGQPEPSTGTGLLRNLFLRSAWSQFQTRSGIRRAIESGLPPLAEHELMLELACNINRQVSRGLADAISRSIDQASFTGLFDTIGAIVAQQFVLMPYYLAFFHQNKERRLLRQITGQQRPKSPDTLRVGLFTDTFDETNGVGRFIRDMLEQSRRSARQLIVHTCTANPEIETLEPGRKNFQPLISWPLPYYPQLSLNLPPVLEILAWADQQQFDAVHVSTPGPMGLCGWLVAKMLRVPMAATYHTDFPAYAERLTKDHRITRATIEYMKWFYGAQASAVFTRSLSYQFNLRDLGVADEKLRRIRPGLNLAKFRPMMRQTHRDPQTSRRLLYCGRVSVEKNLPMLVEIFRTLCRKRKDLMLIVAGDGPYLQAMKSQLEGLPVQFLGFQNDAQLVELYTTSDLLIFPSRTDTLGQVVMEAQACGLPAIVSNEGGPKETVEHNATGLVLAAEEIEVWCKAICDLLNDEPRRQRMSRLAAERMAQFSLDRSFEAFWSDHLAIVEPPAIESEELSSPSLQKSV